MVLALAARSSDDEEVTETSFTHSQYGSETTMTFTAVGDEIMEKTKTLKMARTNPAAAQNKPHNTFDPLVEGSQGIDWYDRSIEYGQTSATETVVIDYGKLAPTGANAGGFPG